MFAITWTQSLLVALVTLGLLVVMCFVARVRGNKRLGEFLFLLIIIPAFYMMFMGFRAEQWDHPTMPATEQDIVRAPAQPVAKPALLIGYELKIRPNETWSVDSRDSATGEFKYSGCLLAEGGKLKVIYMAEGYALVDYQPAADLLGGAAHECASGTLVMMPEDEFLREMERSLTYFQADARKDATRIYFRRVLNGTMEASSDNPLIPVGLTTGQLEFHAPLGGLLPPEPTSGDLPVCATSPSGTLRAMAVSYGQVLAKYAVAGPVSPDPYFAACADDAVVVIAADSFLLNDQLRADKQAKQKAADAFNEWLRARSDDK